MVKSFLSEYAQKASHDEMFENQEIKEHYKVFAQNLASFDKETLLSRQNDIEWHLEQNGVTYNVFSDGRSQNRLWGLDPLPLLIDADEFTHIEKGLMQRAKIFDFILRDIYGEKTLITKGLIPAEVILAHRDFLYQCDGISYSTSLNLLLYGCDLARGPDGQMWVIDDKTSAPSGLGYALENRLTIGRVMSDLYDGMHIKKVTSFFNDFKEMLTKASPKQKENPLIVLLTPGPLSETYFEHSYLASYLGLALVQGADLVVKDGFLWLKSLQGLKLVDVVLRRVDDAYCDPLELKSDSWLGVAGLLDVARSKNVTIINQIGSGILENPALIPFLPNIAKEIFDEELILPQVASWWCGQDNELEYVLNNIAKLVIKTIDKSQKQNTIFGHLLSLEQINELKQLILQNRYHYVGQEQAQFCTSATLCDGELTPQNTIWRTFCIAKENSFRVMPGGLVRVAKEPSFVCEQGGLVHTSKDIWIVSDVADCETKVQKKLQSHSCVITKLEELPSLRAENLFWVGRYTARGLFSARYLRMLIKHISDAKHHERDFNEQVNEVLCTTLTHITMTYPGFLDKKTNDKVAEIISIMMNTNRIGTLAQTLAMLKNANQNVSNLWSIDAIRVFNRLIEKYEHFCRQKITHLRQTHDILDELIIHIMAFIGLVQESIIKDQGLVLYLLGANIEEALLSISKTRAILSLRHPALLEYELIENYLSSFEALNTYRYRYKSHLRFDNAVNLMIFEPNYSKSLAYKITKILQLLEELPHNSEVFGMQEFEKPVFLALSKLRLVDFAAIMAQGDDYSLRKEFDDLLFEVSNLLIQTSNKISTTFFSHT